MSTLKLWSRALLMLIHQVMHCRMKKTLTQKTAAIQGMEHKPVQHSVRNNQGKHRNLNAWYRNVLTLEESF